jgi:hypothetical protein
MNNEADNETIRERFTDFARTFKPVGPKRYAKLMVFKAGITELRQKGASYRLIREALLALGVTVAVDTLGNFCRDVIEQRPPCPIRSRKRVRSVSEPSSTAARPLSDSNSAPSPASVTAPSPQSPTPASDPLAERSRSRGPRIASAHRTTEHNTP